MATRGVILALLLGGLQLCAALGSGAHVKSIRQGRKFTPSHGEIVSLPGFDGPMPSKHYGGFITVDEEAGRHLYYYLALSEDDPAGDPVVLWMNGGPGCSSFDGFMFEHGPFNFAFKDASLSEVKLTANPHSWNKAASVIYLDSPAGVGYSYSETPRDYSTNDTHTAADTEAFLRGFFTRYPDLAQLDFYIAGESYAGIYVPNAARAVVHGNKKGHKPYINIQGYVVGNGCTDAEYDGNALPPFAAGKSLISQAMYSRLVKACDGSFWNAGGDGDCGQRLQDTREELAGLNVYNVLEECHHGPQAPPSGLAPAADTSAAARALQQAGARRQLASERYASLLASHKGWPVGGGVPDGPVRNWAQLMGGLSHNPPCTDASEGDVWLNDPRVREALHAAPVDVAGAPWTICSDRVLYSHDSGSMIRVHRELTQKRGLRALIFSGDHDMAVPHTGSEAWTRDMGLEKRAAWQPWFVGEPRQVAGYKVEYEGLTFATVKGAGHMVPQFKPAESLAMFNRFLAGDAL
ncbi:MAG: peptidase S10, serine carboxypeptidase [Monoraphidium minutum]|nr:MAG: peptidase S10, serine carboxypeptidase [Monoraphidium minutum]